MGEIVENLKTNTNTNKQRQQTNKQEREKFAGYFAWAKKRVTVEPRYFEQG